MWKNIFYSLFVLHFLFSNFYFLPPNASAVNVNTSVTVSLIPTSPSDLSATAASQTQINISWSDNSANEGGFSVERKTAGGSYSEIATTTANIANYFDAGLTSNTHYFYQVRAFSDSGYSAYTNEADATTLSPPPPSITPPSGGGGGEVFLPLIRLSKKLPPGQAACDFQGDGKCNVIDLSILLYFMDKPIQISGRYDLNGDGKIDLKDISILFYYWAE